MTGCFEERIRELTEPINGQLPRPWMTSMTDPQNADVFIIGMNQRQQYPADRISHQRHLDALFNRNGESCRRLYDEVTNGNPSRTRGNIDKLSEILMQHGIHKILETDVICYSTPMSKDLRQAAHAEGAKRGKEVFRYLLDEIQPPILIVHGAGARKELAAVLGTSGLQSPSSANDVCDVETNRHLIIPIRSLGQPEFNKWSSWSSELMGQVAARVRDRLA